MGSSVQRRVHAAKVCVALASVAILLFVVACRDSMPPGCDICTTSAVIRGTVRRADGTPVPDVAVTIEAHAQSCNGPTYTFSDPVRTANDGSYRSVPKSLTGPFLACLVVSGLPPASTGLRAAADSGATVMFRADYGGDGQHDSTRVDLVLLVSP